MAKVYIVFTMYHENDGKKGTHCYNQESISKVFDSEKKAVDWIRDCIKYDCESYADRRHSGMIITKYSSENSEIQSWNPVFSYEATDDEVYICQRYRYEPQNVC